MRNCSPFAARLIERHPDWLEQLERSGRLDEPSPPHRKRADEWVLSYGLDDGLRHFRNQEMLRIIWRELCGLASLGETMADLSVLAERCLQAAIETHQAELVEKHGRPLDGDGKPVLLSVIGLGKLGGCELNLSSDIDVLFCYSASGQCGGPRTLSNEQYFSRLVRRVIASLSDVRDSGFAFRVDTRLRPFGSAGPLASSLESMEQYYQREGRDWERYALIKARPVGGDIATGQSLLDRLQPFVYRRYIDFGAIDSLREMQAMVRADTARKDREGDIKRGRGGIREVEFLAQGFQILRGGREPGLRTPRLDQALDAVLDCKLLPRDIVEELREHYMLLRHVENRLQAMRDEQTHQIPSGEDLARLVTSMGLSGPAEFEEMLDHARSRVADIFDETWAAPDEKGVVQRTREESPWNAQWLAVCDPDRQSMTTEGNELASLLGPFLSGLKRRPIGSLAQARLDRFMPILLQKLDEGRVAPEVVSRLLDLVLVVVQRSAYLALLTENLAALDRTIDLFARSRWVASRVSRFPELLDELIDPALGKHIADKPSLERAIERKLEGEEEETALASLNYLKQAHSLRIAVAYLEQQIDAESAQVALTELAEAIIGAALQLAETRLRARHGKIQGRAMVIGYGSLGAMELGFESDLDIVFLYRSGPNPSSGPRPLAPERWFSRLAQRTVSMLSAVTPSGRLYEIDARLRPNGRAGLLVSTLESFETYQMEEAWTWELQALTRARPVAGDQELAARFAQIRSRALGRPRDGGAVRSDLLDMRARISEHAGQERSPTSRIKHMPGGLIDLGFVTQAGVLALAADHPEVVDPHSASGQIRALARSGWLSEAQRGRLEKLLKALQAARISVELEIESAEPGDSIPEQDARWVAGLLESIPMT